MAVDHSPACKKCRREGIKLYLIGTRCYTDKCAMERRPYPPGQHGLTGRIRFSDYGVRLREKQKVKRIYGVLERQFRLTFERARRQRGNIGENFLILLERRLDNVVYRLGFARSRREARQIVSHGHVLVNGRKVNIPSYTVREGDVIELDDKLKKVEWLEEAFELAERRVVSEWLEVDIERRRGVVKSLPRRDHITYPINESYIVELYSR